MNRIKQLRLEANLSQKELADLIDVNQTAVSQWERGATMPRFPQVSKLCDVLHVSEAYLLGMSDSTTKKAPTPEEVNALPEAQALREVMENLSPDDRQRVLEFGRNLAMTQQKPKQQQ